MVCDDRKEELPSRMRQKKISGKRGFFEKMNSERSYDDWNTEGRPWNEKKLFAAHTA